MLSRQKLEDTDPFETHLSVGESAPAAALNTATKGSLADPRQDPGGLAGHLCWPSIQRFCGLQVCARLEASWAGATVCRSIDRERRLSLFCPAESKEGMLPRWPLLEGRPLWFTSHRGLSRVEPGRAVSHWTTGYCHFFFFKAGMHLRRILLI